MARFVKIATTDELEAQQAKLVEVEGQKIALFRGGRDLLCPERYMHAPRRPLVRGDGGRD